MPFLRIAKNNKEKLFVYFKNLKFFFCLFLFILFVFLGLILNVNADSSVTGGGLPGYSVQSGSGVGYGSQQNYYDIFKSFGGLGPGLGSFSEADRVGAYDYYVGRGVYDSGAISGGGGRLCGKDRGPEF